MGSGVTSPVVSTEISKLDLKRRGEECFVLRSFSVGGGTGVTLAVETTKTVGFLIFKIQN